MVTDEGTKSVESGVAVSQNTSHAFAGVREGINQVVMSNQQITLTLKQQVNAVEQVIEAMTVLNVAPRKRRRVSLKLKREPNGLTRRLSLSKI